MLPIERGTIDQKVVILHLINNNTKMTLQEKLGKAVAQLRKQRNISQEQFAFDSGIARKYMSEIENGKRNISLDVIERLAHAFRMRPSQLFEYVENL